MDDSCLKILSLGTGSAARPIAVRVRKDVVALAIQAKPPHMQRPAYYDELDGELVLKSVAPGSVAIDLLRSG